MRKQPKQKINSQYKEINLLQIVHHLLVVAVKYDAKEIIVHTHHHPYRNTIRKIITSSDSEKTAKIKQRYPEFMESLEKLDYFKYELIKKEKNKEVIEFLQKEYKTPIKTPKKVYKAYVDASLQLQLERAHIGGILKDERGQTRITFSTPCSYHPATTRVELEAVMEMMKYATEAGYTPAIIHTDNQGAYKFFRGTSSRKRTAYLRELVRQAKRKYPDCTVVFVPRKENKEAHELVQEKKETLCIQ